MCSLIKYKFEILKIDGTSIHEFYIHRKDECLTMISECIVNIILASLNFDETFEMILDNIRYNYLHDINLYKIINYLDNKLLSNSLDNNIFICINEL